MDKRMYLYRAYMHKNGEQEDTDVFLYARNKQAAKDFCRTQFGKFDHFDVVKFGETLMPEDAWPACFVEEKGEQALLQANIATSGEKYAERRS